MTISHGSRKIFLWNKITVAAKHPQIQFPFLPPLGDLHLGTNEDPRLPEPPAPRLKRAEAGSLVEQSILATPAGYEAVRCVQMRRRVSPRWNTAAGTCNLTLNLHQTRSGSLSLILLLFQFFFPIQRLIALLFFAVDSVRGRQSSKFFACCNCVFGGSVWGFYCGFVFYLFVG